MICASVACWDPSIRWVLSSVRTYDGQAVMGHWPQRDLEIPFFCCLPSCLTLSRTRAPLHADRSPSSRHCATENGTLLLCSASPAADLFPIVAGRPLPET